MERHIVMQAAARTDWHYLLTPSVLDVLVCDRNVKHLPTDELAFCQQRPRGANRCEVVDGSDMENQNRVRGLRHLGILADRHAGSNALDAEVCKTLRGPEPCRTLSSI